MVILIKLGGSIISDKSKPFSFRRNIIERISKEIKNAIDRGCIDKLVIVHGGGSYGHFVVKTFGKLNNDAVRTTVFYMRELNDRIAEILNLYGVPAIPLDTHAIAYYDDSLTIRTDIIMQFLNRGLVPVVYGDVVISRDGFSILSGDEIVWYLASKIDDKNRIVFLVDVDGVLDRDGRVITTIYLNDIPNLSFSKGTVFDVTGGMKHKLELALKYASVNIEEVVIMSGFREGNLFKYLCREGDVVCSRIIMDTKQ